MIEGEADVLGCCLQMMAMQAAHNLTKRSCWRLLLPLPAGVLHVSSAQAASCLERFPSLLVESGMPPAPAALPPLQDVLGGAEPALAQRAGSSTGGSATAPTVVREALCLATPPDSPVENRLFGQAPPAARSSTTSAGWSSPFSGGPNNTARGASSNSSSPLGPGRLLPPQEAAAEELFQLEGGSAAVAYQYSVAHRETLAASAAVRRRRRRALLRLVREGRVLACNLLSSLSSWDDDDNNDSTGNSSAASDGSDTE